MKKVLLWILKAGISGIIAFTLLTGFCMLYYNIPIDQETLNGATDYTWEPNRFFSRGTEGFAWGKTNNEGYVNTYDYTENTQVDILVMGSSHMEAYQLAMDQSTAAVLGSLLPDRSVYNIGLSSHNFMVCADNLSAAVEKYKPTEYVLIETATLLFSDDQLQNAINETVPSQASHSSGIMQYLKANPFLRLIHSQLEAFQDPDIGTAATKKAAGSDALYDSLLKKMNHTVTKQGAKLIIVYHPQLLLAADGSVSIAGDPVLLEKFSSLCRDNGILFLDMSEQFLKNYTENHVLPHGFTNTSVGSGHLNKDGHRMIAQALYHVIKEAE